MNSNQIKTLLLGLVGLALATILGHLVVLVFTLFTVRTPLPEIANPAVVQQQNIQKAYDLINSQTIPD